MPSFSEKSLKILSDADPKLQDLFNEVVKYHDCKVVCSFRNQEAQDKAYSEGYSKLKYPFSKHNKLPSQAVDVLPYPQEYNDREAFYYFAGFVMATAMRMKINIKWGGDFDRDNDFKDQNFEDLPHWELI